MNIKIKSDEEKEILKKLAEDSKIHKGMLEKIIDVLGRKLHGK